MAEFVKVATTADIAHGERLFYDFEEESIIVFNVNGEYFAIADLCSHDDGPLADGPLDGYSVACPRHGACFDIRTGKVLSLPATRGIPSFQVKVEAGNILVESPDDW